MRQVHGQEVTKPDLGAMANEDAVPFRRVLVPVEAMPHAASALSLASRIGRASSGCLRLVHVRMWEPMAPGSGARWYPETSEEATATLDSAMTFVWARGAAASGVILDAPRPSTAATILEEASRWEADVMVLAARPRRILNLGVWDRVTRQVMRSAACPVLLVYPRRP